MQRTLSEDSKEQLAIALIMLKEWKFQSCDCFEEKIDTMMYVAELAKAIGINKEFENFLSKVSFDVKEKK